MSGAVLKGGSEELWGLTALYSSLYLVVRAYGYLEVGPLLGLSGLSGRVTMGTFSTPLLKPLCLKGASTESTCD